MCCRHIDLEPRYDTLTIEHSLPNGTLAKVGQYSRLGKDAVGRTMEFNSSVLLRMESDGSTEGSGFVVQFTVRLPGQPGAVPGAASPGETLQPEATVPSGGLCDAMFTVHGATYYTDEAGGYITNDLAWRRAQAGYVGDGADQPLALPPLPSGSLPRTWLRPYAPYSQCTWTFYLPRRAILTLWLEFLDLEEDADFLAVFKAPANGAAEDLPELLQYSGSHGDLPQAKRMLQYNTSVQGSTLVYVSFKSDAVGQLTGFLLRWVAWMVQRSSV